MKSYKYAVEIVSALILYVLVLVFSLTYLKNNDIEPQFKIVITLLPVVPFLFMLFSIIKRIAQLDELQLKIQLCALTFASLGTAFISFSYGFLENIGFPNLSMFMIWPIIALLWGVGAVVGVWRYR
ncbi:hypothetical protein [Acinetobacter apis]|nr:hypothetical protein [Acinetobacter apis]